MRPTTTVVRRSARQTIVIGNRPPTASFDFRPAAPLAGQLVTFFSTADDPDKNIERIDWDLDGDGAYEASGSTASRTFPAGSFNVSMRVTDTGDSFAIVTQTIVVGVPAPAPKGDTNRLRALTPFPIVRMAGRIGKRGTKLRVLTVDVPGGSTVTVRCSGKGCPFAKSTRAASAAAQDADPQAREPPAEKRDHDQDLRHEGRHDRQVHEHQDPWRQATEARRPVPDARQHEAGTVPVLEFLRQYTLREYTAVLAVALIGGAGVVFLLNASGAGTASGETLALKRESTRSATVGSVRSVEAEAVAAARRAKERAQILAEQRRIRALRAQRAERRAAVAARARAKAAPRTVVRSCAAAGDDRPDSSGEHHAKPRTESQARTSFAADPEEVGFGRRRWWRQLRRLRLRPSQVRTAPADQVVWPGCVTTCGADCAATCGRC